MDGGAMTDQLLVYSVLVSREDDLWVAVVDALPGGATDVERFEDLHDAVHDLIATLTDTEIENFRIEWRYRQGSYELTELILDLQQWEKQAEVATLNRDAARKAVVEAMRMAGLSYREIADVLGVSFQRVGQLVDAAKSKVEEGA
jgi:DNA-directed RNA polymerase specialized sigma24 family protein